MKKTLKNSINILLLITLIVSASCLTSCAFRQPQIKVIPADKMILALPNGNFEVTPAWLKERYEFERWQKEQLEKCENK